MTASTRDALWFHALFLAVAVPWLILSGGARAVPLLWLTLGYNLGLLLWGFVRGHSEWLFLWLFLLPLCLGQLLPEWALVRVVGVLQFPDPSRPRLGGDVPLYLPGLWMLALFPLLLIGLSRRHPVFSLTPLALLLFVALEWAARPLGLWTHQGVLGVHGIALYPLLPQLLLTLVALAAYRSHARANPLARVGIALAINVFYAGALLLSLLATEYIFRSALLRIL